MILLLMLVAIPEQIVARDTTEGMNQVESEGEKYWKAYDKRNAKMTAEMAKVQNAGENYWRKFHQQYAASQKQHIRETLQSCVESEPYEVSVEPEYKIHHLREESLSSSKECVYPLDEAAAKSRLENIEKKEYEMRQITRDVDRRVNQIINKLEIIAEQLVRTNKLIQELNDKL